MKDSNSLWIKLMLSIVTRDHIMSSCNFHEDLMKIYDLLALEALYTMGVYMGT